MNLQGAEKGRVRLISEPIQVAVVNEAGDEATMVFGRLRWVPPKVETVCRLAAAFYLGRLGGRAPAESDLIEEQQRLMMSWALRRDDGQAREFIFAFPDILDEKVQLHQKDELLFNNLHDAEIRNRCADVDQIWRDYQLFLQTELPPLPTDAQIAELLEDAKKKSLLTLLSERDFWSVLRALRGLADQLRASGTGNTGGGRP